MEPSNKTLTSLWVDDAGQMCNIMSTPSTPGSSSQPPDDILKFYTDQGFDKIAKEAGIIESSEELLTISKANTASLQPKTIKLIAVPVSSAIKNQFRVVPRTVVVSHAAPLNISGVHPQTYITLPAQPAQRMAIVHQQQPSQQQQQQQHQLQHLQPQQQHQLQAQQQHQQQPQHHTVMPKVIQLITTPSYNGGPQIQPQRNQPIWTVSKRPAVPPPTMTIPQPTESADYYTDSKRRKGALGGKGLRHFSTKVCEKVQKKGVTSYNEVADELVNEFTDPCNSELLIDQQFDQKNIRRRVYDALNVLMAMNIISKKKKVPTATLR